MINWVKKNYVQLIFIVFAAVLSIASFVDTQNGGNQLNNTNLFNVERATTLIETYSEHPRPRGSEFHEQVRLGLIDDINATGFTAVEMDYRLTREDALEWGTYYGDALIADSWVRNLLVHIPGTGNGDAILFMGHYDSVPMGPGANDNLIAVATMIEMLHAINDQNMTFENDLIFLFPDGEEEGLYGARLFASQRTPEIPVDDTIIQLPDHIKFLVNHESRGTGGTAIMFETTLNNAKTIELFSSFNRDIYTNSIANFIYSMMPNGTDYSAFSELGIQGINVANIGEGYNYHTQYDRYEELDVALLAQHIQLDHNVLAAMGDYDLSQLYEATENAVFFSYLNLAVFKYSKAFAWGLMITALLILAFVSYRLKSKWLSFLKGLATLIVTLIVTVVMLIGLRPLLETIPVFGVRFGSSSYADTNLMFAIYSLATVIIVLMTQVAMKWLKVTAEAIVHGNIFLFTLLGSALTLVLFEISFLFMVPAIIGLVMIAVTTISPLKKANYLFSLLTFIFLPLAYPLIALASEALGASMYDYIAVIYVLLVSFALPFAVESINQWAKTWHKFSLAAVALLTAIVFIIVEVIAPIGHSLSTNLSGKASGRSVLFTDDSVIFEQNSITGIAELVIKDHDAIAFMGSDFYDESFEHDDASGTYRLQTSAVAREVETTITWSSPTTVVLNVNVLEFQYLEIDLPAGVVQTLSIVENGFTTTHVLPATEDAMIKVFASATITMTLSATENVQLDARLYDLVEDDLSLFASINGLVAQYLSEGLHLRSLIHDEIVLVHP